MSAGFQFGDFTWLCERAALTICPLLQTPQGVMPTCYARNVILGSQVWFQPATSFVHVAALAMTAIMLFHVSSKYTAIGRKEIVMFFYIYMFCSLLAFFLDSTVIPTSHEVYAWFAAVYAGSLGALYWCIVMNGLVGFQAWEDGTPRSLWLLRLSCLVVWGVCFFVSIATFKSWASFSYTRPLGLFVTYIVFPLVCVVFYMVSQLILVIRTLDDRWVIGDIIFGIAFYVIGCVILVAFSNTICNAVSHYIDGVFFFSLCMLLTVMMVYKYWDSITKEDLEFSVGSKQAVWEVKEPLNQGNQEYFEDDTTSAFHGGGGSLVGGYASNYYANYPPHHGASMGQGQSFGGGQSSQQQAQYGQQQYGSHY